MSILHCILLFICAVVGIWFMYQYVWKNGNYKGEKIKVDNPLRIMFGLDPMPKVPHFPAPSDPSDPSDPVDLVDEVGDESKSGVPLK
jgi:hypothetical protein